MDNPIAPDKRAEMIRKLSVIMQPVCELIQNHTSPSWKNQYIEYDKIKICILSERRGLPISHVYKGSTTAKMSLELSKQIIESQPLCSEESLRYLNALWKLYRVEILKHNINDCIDDHMAILVGYNGYKLKLIVGKKVTDYDLRMLNSYFENPNSAW